MAVTGPKVLACRNPPRRFLTFLRSVTILSVRHKHTQALRRYPPHSPIPLWLPLSKGENVGDGEREGEKLVADHLFRLLNVRLDFPRNQKCSISQ